MRSETASSPPSVNWSPGKLPTSGAAPKKRSRVISSGPSEERNPRRSESAEKGERWPCPDGSTGARVNMTKKHLFFHPLPARHCRSGRAHKGGEGAITGLEIKKKKIFSPLVDTDPVDPS